jgi:uncharacterized repeat protein (TIGR01451 family)
MALFVRITPRSARARADGALYAFDMTEEQLIERVIGPYDRGEIITLSGRSLPADDILSIEITEIIDQVLGNPLNQLRSRWTTGSRRQTGDWIARHAPSVTDRYVKGPAGHRRSAAPTEPVTAQPPTASSSTAAVAPRRRALLFGRLRRLPTPLAIIADVITVGLFVAAIIGLLVAILSGHRHASTTASHRGPSSSQTVPTSPSAAGSPRSTGVGQIEQGDIYRAMNVTTNSPFADLVTARCGDRIAFRVRIHNGGPDTLTNVKVGASLNQGTASISHGSLVQLSANNNLNNSVVTATAGVRTARASTATYVRHSTELLNYSSRPGGESVIGSLPDGVLERGIGVGDIGPLGSDTVEVQFEAVLNCERK